MGVNLIWASIHVGFAHVIPDGKPAQDLSYLGRELYVYNVSIGNILLTRGFWGFFKTFFVLDQQHVKWY